LLHPEIFEDNLEYPAQTRGIVKVPGVDHPGNPGKTVQEPVGQLQIPHFFLSTLHGNPFYS
jgi:hypothetical protein